MKRATARQLVGRRIVGFDPRPFPTGRGKSGGGRGTTCDPIILLDNGARLVFSVAETDGTEYGVDPLYVPPPSRRRASVRQSIPLGGLESMCPGCAYAAPYHRDGCRLARKVR